MGDKLLEVSTYPLALQQGTADPFKVHIVLIIGLLGCSCQEVGTLSSPSSSPGPKDYLLGKAIETLNSRRRSPPCQIPSPMVWDIV